MPVYTTTEQLLACFQASFRVCTDTRQLKAGDMFFALKGGNFNGNTFARHALDAGALYVVVDEEEAVVDERCLLVEDSLQALQALAQAYRRTFNIPIVAITGSNGKTTTKELMAGILTQAHVTHYTQGNFNNHIGVPLTLLAMPENTEIAVIEMGANHCGEIADLCRIAEPTHGVITNIGYAHLEGFGGIEGVKKGKSELYRYLEGSRGVAFVNRDELYLKDLSATVEHKIEYGHSLAPSLDVDYIEVQVLSVYPHIQVEFLDYQGNLYGATSQLSGEHNQQNVMTAIAVGKYFKVPATLIVAATEAYLSTNNRSQWLNKKGIDFFLDAYNANPSSMRAALHMFTQVEGDKKIVVLGDMLELGEYSGKEHLAIAKYAASFGVEDLILVGPCFEEAAVVYQLKHFITAEDLMNTIDITTWKGAQVMVKGSRGMKLEQLTV